MQGLSNITKCRLFLFFFSLTFSLFAQEVPNKIDFADLRLLLDAKAKREIQNQVNWIAEDKKNFETKLNIAERYFPIITKILRKEGIPEHFKYLALIDNPLKDSLLFWNVDSSLHSLLKLTKNSEIDETQNIVQTTKAIARYLKENHKELKNNWLSVALSYRMDLGTVEEYVQKNQIFKVTNQYEVALTANTPPLIFKLLALQVAYSYHLATNQNIEDELIVYNNKNNKTLIEIAQEYLISVSKLKKYNPWLKIDKVPADKNYAFLIPIPAKSPSREVEVFTSTMGEIIYQTSPETDIHIVEKGETLFKIAQQYKISVVELRKWNKIDLNKAINIGQKLVVASPEAQQTAKKYEPVSNFIPESVVQNTTFHTVSKGESIYTIAKKYNVMASELKRINNLADNTLNTGQRLRIIRNPNPTAATTIATIPKIPVKPNSPQTTVARNIAGKQVPKELTILDVQVKLTAQAQLLIQREVNNLVRNPKYFSEKLERANWYNKMIEEVLQEARLPLDFKYLPIQESTLLPNVVSASNAVGYWQFKDVAAKEVGLQIDSQVDERLNIVAASEGAAKYLKRNNLYFRNWIFSLLSYNMGFTGAKKFMEQNYDEDEIFETPQLVVDEEMHWYVRKFIAHKIAFEKEIGKDKTNRSLNIYYKGSSKTLKQIAEETQTKLEDLQWHNQWLKTNKIPNNKRYLVIIAQKR